MLRPDVSTDEKTRELFEVLRIAIKESDSRPFAENLKDIPTLSFRQIADLVDIILEKSGRERLLLFLFEAGINFNEVPDVLSQLATNANHWDEAPTQATLILMALGVKWSTDGYLGTCLGDNDLLISHSSFSHSYPILRYETKDQAVALLRKKMHAFFLSDNDMSNTWGFIHDLFVWASENGLSKCVNALVDFKWPALIHVSDNKQHDRSLDYVISKFGPKSLETPPKNPNAPLVPKPAAPATAAQQSEFVVHMLNSAPLVISFADDKASAAKKTERPKYYPPVKPKFFIKNGAKVIARPYCPFIDVNYKNHNGAATAYMGAKHKKHEAVLKVLQQRSELIRDDHVAPAVNEKVEKQNALMAKVFAAVKLNRNTLFLDAMKEARAANFNENILVNLCIGNIIGRKIKLSKMPFFAVRIDKELETLNKFFADYEKLQAGLKSANQQKK